MLEKNNYIFSTLEAFILAIIMIVAFCASGVIINIILFLGTIILMLFGIKTKKNQKGI